MIKGAFIFAAGLAAGTIYGVMLGTKLSGLIKEIVESGNVQHSSTTTTVNGETV